jgi:hypothetical protein
MGMPVPCAGYISVRSSVILLLPLFHNVIIIYEFYVFNNFIFLIEYGYKYVYN